MRALLTAAALLIAAPAVAQQAQPEMALMPRALVENAAQWIGAPNATNAVQIYAALSACLADNPVNGVTRRSGPDQCTPVTAALDAQAKQIADLTAEIAKLKAPAEVKP